MGTTTYVIGGGCSGTLAAIHLLRSTGDRVVLAEAGPLVGRGLAYGTTNPVHLLNSRAGTMSVPAAGPDDFTAWCRRRDPSFGDASFAPRAWYGTYLAERLASASAANPRRLEVHSGRIAALRLERGRRPVVVEAGGRRRSADRAVLAVGHAPPADPAWAVALRGHPRYVADPWGRGDALDRVPAGGPVLLVGTGLTAVDVALSLESVEIVAVSRRGLLPQPHVEAVPVPASALDVGSCDGIAPLMRYVRAAAAAGPDWRAVVDALRPAADGIWQRLSPECRDRFLRHAARHWEVHRHRMAPPIAAEVARLTGSGRFRALAGRVALVSASDRVITVTIDGAVRRFAAVVNCTGPGSPLLQPLVAQLLAGGDARSGPHGLGLDTDGDGRLLDAAGRAWPGVHVLGPARRGRLWETTAVAEIRAQAEAL